MGGRAVADHPPAQPLEAGEDRIERIERSGAGRDQDLGPRGEQALHLGRDRPRVARGVAHRQEARAEPVHLLGQRGLEALALRRGQGLPAQRAQHVRAERLHRDQAARAPRPRLGVLHEPLRDGERRDLGSRDDLARLHRLEIVEREDRHALERVDRRERIHVAPARGPGAGPRASTARPCSPSPRRCSPHAAAASRDPAGSSCTSPGSSSSRCTSGSRHGSASSRAAASASRVCPLEIAIFPASSRTSWQAMRPSSAATAVAASFRIAMALMRALT